MNATIRKGTYCTPERLIITDGEINQMNLVHSDSGIPEGNFLKHETCRILVRNSTLFNGT